jgi:SAM-dependent MidA family methyltransferase
LLSGAELPEPAAGEAEQSARLARHIRDLAGEAGGWLPFSQFMQAALYAPGLGYYMGERPIFGAAGDFVTAPEMSPLFARCLASSVASLLAEAGDADILELGAGSGLLASQLCAALDSRGAPPRRYRIVEPSPSLAERQRRFLARSPATAGLLDRFEWLDAPPRDPWRGVALANEVIDALPVDRFRVTRDGCEALGVVARGESFAWEARAANAALAGAVEALQAVLPEPMPPGYVSEVRPGQAQWLHDATAHLARGAMLVSDYGLPRAQYYHASRDGGTLCAFRRHRRIDDVLAWPGAQDLTAWVDYSALADQASGLGLRVAGFATQAHFLLSAGVERELAELSSGLDERERVAQRQAAAMLLLPGEMGERFKLMAVTRGLDRPVAGFGFRDLAGSL